MTINSVEDLIRVLDENPEWMEALRARILTRELLELPERFSRFVAEMQQFRADIQQFVAETQQFRADMQLFVAETQQFRADMQLFVAEMQQFRADMQLFVEIANRRLDSLETNQSEFTAELAVTNRRLSRIENDIGQVRAGHARNTARNYAHIIARRLGLRYVRRLETVDILDITEAADTSGISEGDLESFMRADILIEATDQQRNTHYIAVEVSYTVHVEDTDRAIRNAGYIADFTASHGRTHSVVASIRIDRESERQVNAGEVYWYQLQSRDLEVD